MLTHASPSVKISSDPTVSHDSHSAFRNDRSIFQIWWSLCKSTNGLPRSLLHLYPPAYFSHCLPVPSIYRWPISQFGLCTHFHTLLKEFDLICYTSWHSKDLYIAFPQQYNQLEGQHSPRCPLPVLVFSCTVLFIYMYQHVQFSTLMKTRKLLGRRSRVGGANPSLRVRQRLKWHCCVLTFTA